MNKNHCKQENIRLGTHGEDYGSWMSNPVFYIIGGITALDVVLAVLSFSVFHITVLGVLFSVVAAALMALLVCGSRCSVLCCCGGADGPTGLDHMDQAPVCLWRRRNHGTGSPGCSLPSGL